MSIAKLRSKPAGSGGRDVSRKSVLLVDEHPLLRYGVRAMLSREPSLTVCGEAGSLTEARRLVEELRPDLVLLDIELSDGDSLAFVEQLRALPDGPRVIVLCGRNEPNARDVEALQRGASGFVSKRNDSNELLRAVVAVLCGGTYLGTEVIERLLRRRAR